MKAKLLVGKPGIGKTYSVEQLALEGNYHLVEFNASDTRTALSLKKLSASHKRAINAKKFLYLFDECDGLDKGGAPILAKFLSQAEMKRIPVYLTANNIAKVPAVIQSHCEIINMYPKNAKDIEQILIDTYPDRLGFEIEAFNTLVKEASMASNGDIRRAKQLLLYNNTTSFEHEMLDNLKAIKMIIYEKDRKAVFDYIKQFPVATLYSWLFETFAWGKKKNEVKLLSELNKMIHKTNENYVYSFIAFELPVQKNRLVVKLPQSLKLSKVDENLITKIKEGYKCTKKTAREYLNLIRSINIKACSEDMAKRCMFTKSEMEYLGMEPIKEKPKRVKPKKPVVTAGCLDY